MCRRERHLQKRSQGFGKVEKENAWERGRQVVDENLPTRQHALFLFDDEAMADGARQTWFPNQDRLLIEARIVAGARTLRQLGRDANHRTDRPFI
jgi:hypothetical protein